VADFQELARKTSKRSEINLLKDLQKQFGFSRYFGQQLSSKILATLGTYPASVVFPNKLWKSNHNLNPPHQTISQSIPQGTLRTTQLT
jgi:hypothetical protein